ncbi:hypothetical protein [Cellulomonas soli]
MTGAGVQHTGPHATRPDAARARGEATWLPLVTLAGVLAVVAVLVAGLPTPGLAVVARPTVVLALPVAALLLTRGNIIARARRAGTEPDVAGYGAAVLLALPVSVATLAGAGFLPGPATLTALCLLGIGLVALDRWLTVTTACAAMVAAPFDVAGPFASVLDRPLVDPLGVTALAVLALAVLGAGLLVRPREARLRQVTAR